MLNDEKRISRDPRLREDDILNIERRSMTVLLLSARCAEMPTSPAAPLHDRGWVGA